MNSRPLGDLIVKTRLTFSKHRCGSVYNSVRPEKLRREYTWLIKHAVRKIQDLNVHLAWD